jgi:uncharacterized protein (TIGR04255 family)
MPQESTIFPAVPRVIYGRNTLIEVVCQIRFPSVLRIDAEMPIAFQEKVRGTFPVLQRKHQTFVSGGVPEELAKALQSLVPPTANRQVSNFVTADGCWTLGLTSDFLSLSTRQYPRWEQFRALLQVGVQALREVYEPPFLIRVGLRFQNVIVRTTLGLAGVAWSDLIQPYVLAELGKPELSGYVVEAQRQLGLDLPDQAGRIRMSHGLVGIEGSDEECYLIDSDFFRERTDVGEELPVLDRFDTTAHRLLRWCITDRLHLAMEPAPTAG